MAYSQYATRTTNRSGQSVTVYHGSGSSTSTNAVAEGRAAVSQYRSGGGSGGRAEIVAVTPTPSTPNYGVSTITPEQKLSTMVKGTSEYQNALHEQLASNENLKQVLINQQRLTQIEEAKKAGWSQEKINKELGNVGQYVSKPEVITQMKELEKNPYFSEKNVEALALQKVIPILQSKLPGDYIKKELVKADTGSGPLYQFVYVGYNLDGTKTERPASDVEINAYKQQERALSLQNGTATIDSPTITWLKKNVGIGLPGVTVIPLYPIARDFLNKVDDVDTKLGGKVLRREAVEKLNLAIDIYTDKGIKDLTEGTANLINLRFKLLGRDERVTPSQLEPIVRERVARTLEGGGSIGASIIGIVGSFAGPETLGLSVGTSIAAGAGLKATTGYVADIIRTDNDIKDYQAQMKEVGYDLLTGGLQAFPLGPYTKAPGVTGIKQVGNVVFNAFGQIEKVAIPAFDLGLTQKPGSYLIEYENKKIQDAINNESNWGFTKDFFAGGAAGVTQQILFPITKEQAVQNLALGTFLGANTQALVPFQKAFMYGVAPVLGVKGIMEAQRPSEYILSTLGILPVTVAGASKVRENFFSKLRIDDVLPGLARGELKGARVTVDLQFKIEDVVKSLVYDKITGQKETPGGGLSSKISKGDLTLKDVLDTAVKEIKEETGITIKREDLRLVDIVNSVGETQFVIKLKNVLTERDLPRRLTEEAKKEGITGYRLIDTITSYNKNLKESPYVSQIYTDNFFIAKVKQMLEAPPAKGIDVLARERESALSKFKGLSRESKDRLAYQQFKNLNKDTLLTEIELKMQFKKLTNIQKDKLASERYLIDKNLGSLQTGGWLRQQDIIALRRSKAIDEYEMLSPTFKEYLAKKGREYFLKKPNGKQIVRQLESEQIFPIDFGKEYYLISRGLSERQLRSKTVEEFKLKYDDPLDMESYINRGVKRVAKREEAPHPYYKDILKFSDDFMKGILGENSSFYQQIKRQKPGTFKKGTGKEFEKVKTDVKTDYSLSGELDKLRYKEIGEEFYLKNFGKEFVLNLKNKGIDIGERYYLLKNGIGAKVEIQRLRLASETQISPFEASQLEIIKYTTGREVAVKRSETGKIIKVIPRSRINQQTSIVFMPHSRYRGVPEDIAKLISKDYFTGTSLSPNQFKTVQELIDSGIAEKLNLNLIGASPNDILVLSKDQKKILTGKGTRGEDVLFFTPPTTAGITGETAAALSYAGIGGLINYEGTRVIFGSKKPTALLLEAPVEKSFGENILGFTKKGSPFKGRNVKEVELGVGPPSILSLQDQQASFRFGQDVLNVQRITMSENKLSTIEGLKSRLNTPGLSKEEVNLINNQIKSLQSEKVKPILESNKIRENVISKRIEVINKNEFNQMSPTGQKMIKDTIKSQAEHEVDMNIITFETVGNIKVSREQRKVLIEKRYNKLFDEYLNRSEPKIIKEISQEDVSIKKFQDEISKQNKPLVPTKKIQELSPTKPSYYEGLPKTRKANIFEEIQKYQNNVSNSIKKYLTPITYKETSIYKSTEMYKPVEVYKPVEMYKPSETYKPIEVYKPTEIYKTPELYKPIDIYKPGEFYKTPSIYKTPQEPRKPTKIIPSIKPLYEQKRKERVEQGYDVFGKVVKTNKFAKINSTPLTKDRALDVGSYYVSESLARTFKIEKAGKAQDDYQFMYIPTGFYQMKKGTLREFKIKKGEAVNIGEQFIQKSPFILSSKSEKEQIKRFQREARSILK